MADDEWQLEAVHEQLDVFDTLTTPFERIPSDDLISLMTKVADIKKYHLKMKNKQVYKNPRQISLKIMNYPDGREVKLTFIVIITNIEYDGRLCKMPVFVIMSGSSKIYLDMNLTVFKSWETFLNNNDFPPCTYCFPVGGQYCVGGKLTLDFAMSPAASRQNVGFLWKGLGFVVAVGVVVSSFFFTIPPIDHRKADSLLGIANEFIPGIKKHLGMMSECITAVQEFKRGKMKALSELFKSLQLVYQNCKDEISLVVQKVREALWKLYDYLKRKFNSFFENASDQARHEFIAVASRVDEEVFTADLEADELLEASRKNNLRQQTTVTAPAIHAHLDPENDTRYAITLFENAKNESAFQNGIKNKGDGNVHPITSDLLDISHSLAQQLGKTTLKDAQGVFEAISSIVNDEFKKKITTYTKMLDAARAAAGHEIDLELFNCRLGIKGDPKHYYQQEAIKSVIESYNAMLIQMKIENLEKQKEILILPLGKQEEDEITGIYKITGISGKGKFTTYELIKALKKIHVDLKEDELVVNETLSSIMVREGELTVAVFQEVNQENTSEGILFVTRAE